MKQTTIRLPEKLHEQLKREAEQRGMTMNAYVISILWDFALDEKEVPN